MGAGPLVALLCAALLLAACGGEKAAPARYSHGARVRLSSNLASIILYTACGSPFGRLAGVANAGDEASILDREWCGDAWWYRVQVTALKREEWKGIGWLPESNLGVK